MLRTIVLLTLSIFLSDVVVGQKLTTKQQSEMLDCTFHRKGQWVEQALYPNGKATFSYVMAHPREQPASLYVAFWNPERTEGKLLVFHLSRTPDGRNAYAISNEAWIWNNKGHLDIRDALGGIYMYEQLKAQLSKLRARPAYGVVVDKLAKTEVVCSSQLDK